MTATTSSQTWARDFVGPRPVCFLSTPTTIFAMAVARWGPWCPEASARGTGGTYRRSRGARGEVLGALHSAKGSDDLAAPRPPPVPLVREVVGCGVPLRAEPAA